MAAWFQQAYYTIYFYEETVCWDEASFPSPT